MTQLDPFDPTLTDRCSADLLQPALRLLGETVDREFARREPRQQTHLEWAAHRLGTHAADLAVSAEVVAPPVADAVGVWLLRAQLEHGADPGGADPHLPATTERVPGAHGDVRTFRSALVHLPAGVLHETSVALRLAPFRYGLEVQLLGLREYAGQLSDALAAFLRERRTSGSPYRLGRYRVRATNQGLVLRPATMATATRATLQLDEAVWRTVDRGVHRILALSDRLAARGLGTSAGLLLVGPPGTGKTQLGTVVAGELAGTATVLVPGSEVTEMWLTELFDLAADLAPTLILMDDLDLIAGERGSTQPHRLREFLNVMDGGLADRSGVVVIASTNDPRKIDKAARRSSRFDTVITMEAPGFDGRVAILERYLAWSDATLDLAAVARATDGATGADLKELVRATVLATDDQVTTGALLGQAATQGKGRWASEPAPAGVYL
ncbi:AAA family ATPase [Nocardioides sp.]|uniref:AAA family ATPase n=1 Tax=Nocardioides sp. TaxID=35761 RepID=UPI0035278616